jgi:hypothetical protein
MKTEELDKNGIMVGTENKSVKKECENIGNKCWKRNCPKCNKEIFYKFKSTLCAAMKKHSDCKLCAMKRTASFRNYFGESNPFYGRIHSDETKKKMSNIDKSWMLGDNNPAKRIKSRKLISQKLSGSNHYMFGKHLSNERKHKISIKNSGNKNPRYGKCPPNSSGSGWHSWYKDDYFRSLRELIFYIQNNTDNKKCECVEHIINIKYKGEDGHDRTYRPDFLVDEKLLIEIKPKYLWNSKQILLKKEAAEQFCKENGLEYKLVDVIPDSNILREKYLNGEIRFVEKYKERFEKYAKIK